MAAKKKPKKKVSKMVVAQKPAKKTAAPKKKAAAAKKKSPAVKKAVITKAVKPKPKPKPPMQAVSNHSELDDEAHEEVFEIFKAYDRDGSGSIDRGELARLLEALGQAPDEESLAIALDVVDANHSGRISWVEFRAWWQSQAS